MIEIALVDRDGIGAAEVALDVLWRPLQLPGRSDGLIDALDPKYRKQIG